MHSIELIARHNNINPLSYFYWEELVGIEVVEDGRHGRIGRIKIEQYYESWGRDGWEREFMEPKFSVYIDWLDFYCSPGYVFSEMVVFSEELLKKQLCGVEKRIKKRKEQRVKLYSQGLRNHETKLKKKEVAKLRRRMLAKKRAAEKRKLSKKNETEEKRKQQRQLREAKEKMRIDAANLKLYELANADRTKRQSVLWGELQKTVQSKYLLADSFFKCHQDNLLIPQNDYLEARNKFVCDWVDRNTPTYTHPPDNEQTAAIASLSEQIQVIARAGSGKTTTLGWRALFLIKHCRIDPQNMLMLAFNRKAADEMKKRLLLLLYPEANQQIKSIIKEKKARQERYGKLNLAKIECESVDSVLEKGSFSLPHIMTFHALAHALVQPEEDLLYDDELNKINKQSRFVQNIIDEHIQNPATQNEIRDLMIANFKEDWASITKGGYDLKHKGNLLTYRRSLPCQALQGHETKSFGEKVIADFLFEHDVSYAYEKACRWLNGSIYRPDFTIPQDQSKKQEYESRKKIEKGLIIEYFGLHGDPDYDEMSEQKRAYWKTQRNFELLEFTNKDIRPDNRTEFEDSLKSNLQKRGFLCKRLSDDEIWERIKERAIDSFSRAMKSFIGRCRKAFLNPSELSHQIQQHDALSEVETAFLQLGKKFYQQYLIQLEQQNKEDFDGLLQRAIQKVNDGLTTFLRKSGDGNLKLLHYIFVDEFQDFSDSFYQLLKAIRNQSPSAHLFAVGDNWQAINGFAGSDLRFFEDFNQYLGESEKLYITTNYRSKQSIVGIGNRLMQGNGASARASDSQDGQLIHVNLVEFQPTDFENNCHSGDSITPIVLRLINKELKLGHDVVLLSRSNYVPYYTNTKALEAKSGLKGLDLYLLHVRGFFPEDLRHKINISTAHKYKGLEKDTVIILDAKCKRYPLIHPNWVFTRLFGDELESIIAEEQRLLYVALTRAKNTLYIITDESDPSPLFEEKIKGCEKLQTIEWEKYPPVTGEEKRIKVLLVNQGADTTPTYSIHGLIKKSGYKPKYSKQRQFQGWFRVTNAEMFRIESLESEAWFNQADGVEIRILDENDETQAIYHVNKSKLQQVR